MAKKTISLNVQQAAEQYLASLNSSRDQLTDEQWNTVATYIKKQRIRKRAQFVLILIVIIFASLTVWGFCIINKRIQLYVPDGIVSVKKEGSESAMTIEPEEIENIIKWYVGIGSSIARCFDMTIFCLGFLTVSCFENWDRNRIFRVFIPKLKLT